VRDVATDLNWTWLHFSLQFNGSFPRHKWKSATHRQNYGSHAVCTSRSSGTCCVYSATEQRVGRVEVARSKLQPWLELSSNRSWPNCGGVRDPVPRNQV